MKIIVELENRYKEQQKKTIGVENRQNAPLIKIFGNPLKTVEP